MEEQMPVLYPSQEWCDEWKNAINNSKECKEKGEKWGVDFNGTYLFEISPNEGLEKTKFIYFDAKGGTCHEARMVSGPEEVEAGFHVRGPYSIFKKVVKGEMHFVESLVRGKIRRLSGDFGKIMRNAPFIGALSASISSFEAAYLGE